VECFIRIIINISSRERGQTNTLDANEFTAARFVMCLLRRKNQLSIEHRTVCVPCEVSLMLKKHLGSEHIYFQWLDSPLGA
jgi:hypothetical protein